MGRHRTADSHARRCMVPLSGDRAWSADRETGIGWRKRRNAVGYEIEAFRFLHDAVLALPGEWVFGWTNVVRGGAVGRDGVSVGDGAVVTGQERGVAHFIEVIKLAGLAGRFDAIERTAPGSVHVVSEIARALAHDGEGGERRGVIEYERLGCAGGIAGGNLAEAVIGERRGVSAVAESGQLRREVPGVSASGFRERPAHGVELFTIHLRGGVVGKLLGRTRYDGSGRRII